MITALNLEQEENQIKLVWNQLDLKFVLYYNTYLSEIES